MYYGNTFHETSHIDKLAAESFRFTNAYAAAPVCTPTRASIMTGQWSARLKMTIWSENARGIHGIIKALKYPKIVGNLLRKLGNWLNETEAELPSPNPHYSSK